MSDNSGLHVAGVSHRYGNVEAVSNVSLTVPPGEIHCLLGASGSGKSTLLRVIAGLERQQHGSVAIDDAVMSTGNQHLPTEQRPVGFVFQDYALFPHLNALQNVLFGMPQRRSSESRERAAQLLADAGLAEHVRSMPHTLSGGEQQRVALARAMARTPKVMLLDEPFSGLDVQLRSDVRDTTLRVLRAANIATVMVTHDPSEAISCADRISAMHGGRIAQTDTPRSIYQNPTDDQTARTFGIVNRIPVQKRDGQLMTPYGEWKPASAAAADDVAFVRPEQLMFVPDGSATVRVERVVQEGATTLYVVRTDDNSELFVRCLSGEVVVTSRSVSVAIR